MRTAMMTAVAAMVLLAGCKARTDPPEQPVADNGTVAVRARDGAVAIRLPGFDADMKMPAIGLSAANLDLDGMTLFPETKITGIDIDGSGGKGDVRLSFDAPAPPAAVRDHYVREARQAGWTVRPAAGDAVDGTKPDGSRFRLDLAPNAGGTGGKLALDGH